MLAGGKRCALGIAAPTIVVLRRAHPCARTSASSSRCAWTQCIASLNPSPRACTRAAHAYTAACALRAHEKRVARPFAPAAKEKRAAEQTYEAVTKRLIALDGSCGIAQKGASGIFCRDWSPLQWPQRLQALAASREIAVVYDESRQVELFMPMHLETRLATSIHLAWMLRSVATKAQVDSDMWEQGSILVRPLGTTRNRMCLVIR